MLKRVLATASLIVAVPAFAHAWTVNTWVKTGGGNIVVDSNPAQVSTSGSVFKTYADSTASASVVANASAGHTIKAVTVDGTVIDAAAGQLTYGTTLSNTANHTFYVTYKADPVAVTADAGSNGYGSVTPKTISGVLYGQTVKQAIRFAFTPVYGYKVAGVTVNGSSSLPANIEYVPAAIDGRSAYVRIKPGYQFAGDIAIAATFAPNTNASAVANAGNSQIVIPTSVSSVTLDGTASVKMTSAAWSQVSGPATVTLTPGALGQASFPVAGLPDGTYIFQLAINNVSTTAGTDALGHPVPVVSPLISRTTVTINSSATAAAQNTCVNCHSANNVGTQVYGNWTKSVHSAKVECWTCHTGANTGGHPGKKPTCGDCHSSESTAFYGSPHWNNSVYTPEADAWTRSGQDAALPSNFAVQISDIQVPLEDNDLGNCMNRCHFRPGQGGVTIADNFGSTAPTWTWSGTDSNGQLIGSITAGSFNNTTKTGTAGTGKWACGACHSTGGAQGDGSKGALASGNLGVNKGNPGIVDGQVMPDGTTIKLYIPGVVFTRMSTSGDNKHTVRKVDMYTTCLVCHFGKNHGNPTYAYLKSEHYANPTNIAGKQVQCQDCHNPHSTGTAFPQYDATTLAKTSDGACSTCHTGGYGIFNDDNSMKAPHASGNKIANGGAAVTLAGNPGWYSKTRTVFVNASSQYVTPNNTCKDCHGHNNAINGEYKTTAHADTYGRAKSAKAFKFMGYSSNDVNQYTPATVFVDGCVRCHTTTGFVNFIESDYKDLRAWGFKNSADTTGEVINCRACHRTTRYEEDHPEASAPDAFTQPGEGVTLPEGTYSWKNDYPFTLSTYEGVRNPIAIRGWVIPKFKGGDVMTPDGTNLTTGARIPQHTYTGYYNYSSTAGSVKVVTPVSFNDYKMSNVCVSCHAGRNGATNGAAFNSLASFNNFTSLGMIGGKLPSLPHGVYQSAILNGSIGYQFSAYTPAANSHAVIGTAVSGAAGVNFNGVNTPGPCVSCHMDFKPVTGKPDGVNSVTTEHRKHNFAIRDTTVFGALCIKCHTGSLPAMAGNSNLDTSKTNFQAAVTALATIMETSSNRYGKVVVASLPLGSYGSYSITFDDATHGPKGVSFAPADFAKLMGASYNLQLLYNVAFAGSDTGAYAHNPGYLKHLLKDTIDYLRDPGTVSVSDAINQLTTLDATTRANAVYYLQ